MLTPGGWVSDREDDDPERAVEDPEHAPVGLQDALDALESVNARLEAQLLAVADREARLSAIFNTALDGIVTVDEHGIVEDFNQAAEAMFGYQATEVVGQNVSMLMPSPHSEQHPGYIERFLAGGEPGVIGKRRELSGRRKDGTIFPLRLGVTAVQDHRPLFTAIIQDITEDKAKDTALRNERDFAESLVETAPVIVLVLDPKGRIVRFNRFMEELSGYTLDEVRGADWFETFLPPRDRGRIRERFVTSVGGRRTRAASNPIVTKGGKEREIEWYDTELNDRDTGELVGVLAIGMDVTDGLRLEDQVRRSQKMEAIGTLSAGVAHDFNNLLMGIIGMSDMARGKLGDHHDARRFVHEIRKAALGGAAIVEQLMNFSRTTETEQVDLNLDRVIEDAAPMLRTLVGEDVMFGLDLSARSAHVHVAPGHIEQILMNLVANARHALDEGGTISVRSSVVSLDPDDALVSESTPPGQYVVLEVADDGCGMDDKTAERIFEPFYTTKDSQGGTGLGLSTVYAIVDKSEGHITVDSELRVGSTFRILLPRRRPSMVGLPSPVAEETAGHGELVLVVEDEELVRLTMRHYLEAAGYRVVEAGTVADGLSACERHTDTIDILLCDMILPGGRGPMVAQRLREVAPNAAVAFMSAHSQEHLVSQGQLTAETTTLQKPFTKDDLLTTMRRALADSPARTPGASTEPGGTVLVVEDYRVARMAAVEFLIDEGYDVVAVSGRDGALAAMEARGGAIDLVLTDLGLPDGSGLELAERLLEANPAIKVLFMSGRPRDAQIEAALERLDARFLIKPVTLAELGAAVGGQLAS